MTKLSTARSITERQHRRPLTGKAILINIDAFQIRMNWRRNERKEDEYDFSDVDKLLELAEKNGHVGLIPTWLFFFNKCKKDNFTVKLSFKFCTAYLFVSKLPIFAKKEKCFRISLFLSSYSDQRVIFSSISSAFSFDEA